MDQVAELQLADSHLGGLNRTGKVSDLEFFPRRLCRSELAVDQRERGAKIHYEMQILAPADRPAHHDHVTVRVIERDFVTSLLQLQQAAREEPLQKPGVVRQEIRRKQWNGKS